MIRKILWLLATLLFANVHLGESQQIGLMIPPNVPARAGKVIK